MAFVRVYGRATPDRAGARPYHGGQTLCLMLTQMGGRPAQRRAHCGRLDAEETTEFVKRFNSHFSNEK